MDGEAAIWITAIVALLVYNLYKLRHSADPKDELLKAKKLVEENLISEADYEKIKAKLVRKIISD